MSDVDDPLGDLLMAGGLVWMFSILIKGLLYALFGIYIILFVIYAVSKEMYQIIKEVRENRSDAESRAEE